MRRGVLCSFFVAALIAFFCAPQLRADGIATFTYTDSTGTLTYVWTLPVQPTLDPSFLSPGILGAGSFTITTNTLVITSGGTTLGPQSDIINFFDANTPNVGSTNNGGLLDIGALILTTSAGDQFFSGTASNPFFVPMAFIGDVTNSSTLFGGDTGGTLIISTPEPSALVLLFVGLCTLLIVSFRGRPSV
jgi:hypothetical protein